MPEDTTAGCTGLNRQEASAGQEASAAQFAQQEKERRARLPKPQNAEEKRLAKMRVELKRMGIKPSF